MLMLQMTSDGQTYEYFATCARGFEGLLADELRALQAPGQKLRIRPLQNGVAFFGTLEQGLRACLWLRTASRVLLIVDRVAADDGDELYKSLLRIPWEDHIDASGTFAIDALGTNKNLRNSQFLAMRSKDAIVDRIRKKRGARPNVQRKRPDVLVNVRLRGDKATIAIDLSGEPLHMRGYRCSSSHVRAPLKETLAAAMLLSSDWKDPSLHSGMNEDVSSAIPKCSAEHESSTIPERSHDSDVVEGSFLLDPFCGSGTIAIEAAMMASNMAPGILRDYWGFNGWLGSDDDIWNALLDAADTAAEAGAAELDVFTKQAPLILANDNNPKVLQVAADSAKRAGLASYISFSTSDIAKLKKPEALMGRNGTLITNPPYAQRLARPEQLPVLYAGLATAVREFDVANVAIITPDDESEPPINAALNMDNPTARIQTMNGPIEAQIRLW